MRYNAALNVGNILKGIDYYRWMEYPVTLTLVVNRYRTNFKSQTKLLDVGSLDTPLPLLFAARDYKVYALDINKRVLKLENTARKMGINNLRSVIADSTKLPFDNNFFDTVTAISTIEHVLPVKDGDSKVMEEIGRVLKPDGIAIITVPYNNKFSKEWRYHPAHKRYLIRGYDEDSVYSRLIKPSGLAISKILYFCDDRGFYKLWYKLLIYLLSPLSFLFASIFLKLRVAPINARGIVIVLEKKGNDHIPNYQTNKPIIRW